MIKGKKEEIVKNKGSEIDSKMGKEKYRKKEKKREEELERY